MYFKQNVRNKLIGQVVDQQKMKHGIMFQSGISQVFGIWDRQNQASEARISKIQYHDGHFLLLQTQNTDSLTSCRSSKLSPPCLCIKALHAFLHNAN